MKITFLEANKRLGKSFGMPEAISKNGELSYPKVKKLTSHEFEIPLSKAGLQDLHKTLIENAKKGRCLLKGPLKEPIVNESRAGKTDNEAQTQHVVLDIDGLNLDKFKNQKVTDIKQAAEIFISMMPAQFRDVSYIVHASSSAGYKTGARMHLHFFLSEPVHPSLLKRFYRSLNLMPDIATKITLNDNCTGIKLPIDLCTADNSRIIYIAPPKFAGDLKDPFPTIEDRCILVEKEQPLLGISDLINEVFESKINELESEIYRELCKLVGIKPIKLKIEKTKNSRTGEVKSVVVNPPPCTMIKAYESEDYVYYNMPNPHSDGNSNSYFVPKTNPEVVHCFKPGVESFLFEKACTEAYSKHIEEYGINPDTIAALSSGMQNLVILDEESGKYVCLRIDHSEKAVVRETVFDSKTKADNWIIDTGGFADKNYPVMTYEFKPTSDDLMWGDETGMYINKYMASPLVRKYRDLDPIEKYVYTKALETLREASPTIAAHILHVCGDDEEVFCRFINWLSFAVKNPGKKTRNAWIFQGRQGTGKGVFHKNILAPIVGRHNVFNRKLHELTGDKFDAWQHRFLFGVLDEFDVKDGDRSLNQTIAHIKHLITEENVGSRGMHKENENSINYLNIMAFTNKFGDAFQIEEGDRRWNVAPRQEVSISVTIPDIIKKPVEYDALIADELDGFAKYLFELNTDNVIAQTCLENAAKARALAEAIAPDVMLCRAFARGSLGMIVNKFLDAGSTILEKQTKAEMMPVVKEWIFLANHDIEVNILCSDMRNFFNLLFNKEVTQQHFTRILNREHVVTQRIRSSTGRGTGIKVKFTLHEKLKSELLTDPEFFNESDLIRLKKSYSRVA